VEIWNLVFMQYNRDAGGVLTPLPRPSIDTGMGLERVAAVLQGKLSNYETDLIRPIIDQASGLFHVAYGEDARVDTALRIVADHARAAEFLIHDGVLPSNEGRGYVLRKIMRRAMRNARMAGVEEPFLYKLTGFVAGLMQSAYPELLESVERVARVVKEEEHRYATTFLVAEKVFGESIKSLEGGTIPGAVSFKLYDTYGLAPDEQEEMARERGLALDRAGFEREMEQQRERARASWKGAEKGAVVPAYQQLLARGRTKFLGYETTEADATVIGLIVDQNLVERVPAGARVDLVLDRTPFYAESGGQVGDQGEMLAGPMNKVADVESVFYGVPGLTVHRTVARAPIAVGDGIVARVTSRDATRRNHTATHLLHAALRQVLGTHVKQAGSVVEPGRLRFDFTHYAAMDRAEIEEVERIANRQILKNTPVETRIMALDEAIATGAMALFGEKYGEEVRVVSVPGFSRELCGGTHVSRTGDIGVCKIVYEGSISAGVRRLEAITGEAALRQYQESTDALRGIAGLVKAPEPELIEHVEKMLATERALEKQVEQLKNKLAQAAAAGLEAQARTIAGAKVLAARLDGMDRQQMRSLADSLRNKWKSAVVALASADDSGVAIVTAVTKDLTAKVHAGKLAGALAQAVGKMRPRSTARWRRSTARSRASCEGGLRRGGGGRGTHGPRVRNRASAARPENRAGGEGLRGQFHLSLPHQHDVLHHAGAARNRQHPDDQPERQAQSDRSAEVLPARGGALSAGCAAVRTRGPDCGRRRRIRGVHHRPGGIESRVPGAQNRAGHGLLRRAQHAGRAG
jgi:alanyl-tRNA synthetase